MITIEMSETVTNEAMEQTQGMFADMVKNIKDQTAAARLMAFLNGNVASQTSVALMQDIPEERGGRGISQEKWLRSSQNTPQVTLVL